MPKPDLDPATSALTSGNLISGLTQTIHPGLKQRLIVAGPGSTRWGALPLVFIPPGTGEAGDAIVVEIDFFMLLRPR